MRGLLSLWVVLFVAPVSAVEITAKAEKEYLALGGSPKALQHLRCLLRHQEGRRLPVKKLDPANGFAERCNQFPEMTLQNLDYAVVVNYTVPSSRRRMFLIPTERRPNASVRGFYVAHGRNGNTDHGNTTPKKGSNTILNAKYFSNEIGSNASSTGFFITGETYLGDYQGSNPKNPKHSLYLHGMEAGLNDNACERATVFHGSGYLRESGSSEGTNRMSSGCLMLDYNVINGVTNLIKGPDAGGGSAVLVYGPREASLDSDFYCQ